MFMTGISTTSRAVRRINVVPGTSSISRATCSSVIVVSSSFIRIGRASLVNVSATACNSLACPNCSTSRIQHGLAVSPSNTRPRARTSRPHAHPNMCTRPLLVVTDASANGASGSRSRISRPRVVPASMDRTSMHPPTSWHPVLPFPHPVHARFRSRETAISARQARTCNRSRSSSVAVSLGKFV